MPLCANTLLRGNSLPAASKSVPCQSASIPPASSPISKTCHSPTYSSFSGNKNASFGNPNVKVASALTTAVRSFPELSSHINPEGTSTAYTGLGSSFIRRIIPAANPSTGRFSPVPKRASTTTASSAGVHCPGSATATTLPPISRHNSAFRMQSPLEAQNPSTHATSTSQPASASIRAIAKPSPPLLPFPATTATGGIPSTAFSKKAAQHPAARSIKSHEVIPSDSIVYLSIAGILSALYITFNFFITISQSISRRKYKKNITFAHVEININLNRLFPCSKVNQKD